MPLPDGLARFNRMATNRVLGPLARIVPPMAVVVHRGRRTGRTYRTPVLAFEEDGRWTIALTYGPDRDWVRNVVSAEGCGLERARGRIELGDPRFIATSEGMRRMPGPVRAALRALKVTGFLELRS